MIKGENSEKQVDVREDKVLPKSCWLLERWEFEVRAHGGVGMHSDDDDLTKR